jgi:hypothetical protein
VGTSRNGGGGFDMGKGDRRHSLKMRQRKAHAKNKARHSRKMAAAAKGGRGKG